MEIAELGRAVCRDVDVIRMQIPVRHAAGVRAVQSGCDFPCQLDDRVFTEVKTARQNAVGQALRQLHADQVRIAEQLAVLLHRLQILVLIGDDIRAVLHLIEQVGFQLGALLFGRELHISLFLAEESAGSDDRNDLQCAGLDAVHAPRLQTEDGAVRSGADFITDLPLPPKRRGEGLHDALNQI